MNASGKTPREQAAKVMLREVLGVPIPYVGHLLSVAGIVIDFGGTEDEAIAALLHDAVKDQGGPFMRETIRRLFGDEVASTLDACSDTDEEPKPSWRLRKTGYIAHLRTATPSAALVSAADKLANAKARALVVAPDISELAGKRDRALLGLLLECGLRRDEAVTVQVEQVQERNERWVLADLLGKGRKFRTVPIPTRCAVKILDWIEAARITTGPILRSIDRHGHIGAGMSTTAAYKIVRRCAKDAGITKLAPHDLRRTFGRLAHANGAKIEQISLTYGHSKISTTERYLGIEQDLDTAPCDTMDIEAGTNRKERK